MKKHMRVLLKIISAVFICCTLALAFTACNTSKELELVDDVFLIGYGKYIGFGKGHAYIAEVVFDGETYDYTIPDDYKGYKITALGGYHGTGLPCPFGISLYNKLDEEYGASEIVLSESESDLKGALCVPIKFNVKLGVYVKEVVRTVGKEYCEVIDENGDKLIYYAVYNFTVDENNPFIYSEDGRLYYRKNNVLIDEFFYE